MIKIEKRGYLGIDESNHGRFPEIYVGVYSILDKDVVRGNYSKKRKSAVIDKILDGKFREYKHLLMYQGYKDIFGECGIKIISLAEIIKSYYEKDTNLIIFDGELGDVDRLNLERILHPIKIDHFTFEPKADIIFPIVNKADVIANKLYKYYRYLKKLQDGNKYLDTRIDFDINKYLKFRGLFE